MRTNLLCEYKVMALCFLRLGVSFSVSKSTLPMCAALLVVVTTRA